MLAFWREVKWMEEKRIKSEKKKSSVWICLLRLLFLKTPNTSAMTEPGCCLHHACWQSTIPGLISCHTPKPLIPFQFWVGNKKVSLQMLAAVEMTASSFECDLRAQAAVRERQGVWGVRGRKLSGSNVGSVNSHLCARGSTFVFSRRRVSLFV